MVDHLRYERKTEERKKTRPLTSILSESSRHPSKHSISMKIHNQHTAPRKHPKRALSQHWILTLRHAEHLHLQQMSGLPLCMELFVRFAIILTDL